MKSLLIYEKTPITPQNMLRLRLSCWVFLLVCSCYTTNSANIPSLDTTPSQEVASDVRVECNSDEILVRISTENGKFNGMVYPRGLSKNSSCMGEWVQRKAPIQYTLPLRGCNTMSTELDDGGIEYFNTIVVQPHLKLVTNQGRGFHIRCRYNTRNNTIITNDTLKVDLMSADSIHALAPMPMCNMKIFSGDPTSKEVAENVKIGDPLTLVITLDEQDVYGIRVTDCLVRDGLGWGEQKLINDEGCPLDTEIMGKFEYSADKTRASVKFQAHKFPYTASVYYQCNVKLCIKADGGCDVQVPPHCGSGSNRIRRQAQKDEDQKQSSDAGSPTETPATIEVYSGLYVIEANDMAKAGSSTEDGGRDSGVFSEKSPEGDICVSQRTFAIAICVAGLLLMLCVIAAILCLLSRQRRINKKTSSGSIPGGSSSIYSGPYTNTAYSHSS